MHEYTNTQNIIIKYIGMGAQTNSHNLHFGPSQETYKTTSKCAHIHTHALARTHIAIKPKGI